MYLFRDKTQLEVSITCKVCLEEVKFLISLEEYENVKKFPLMKEKIHGEHAHKLIAFLNKNLEIEEFKIEDVSDKKVSYSQELTRQVLSEIELTDDEIELYILSTGRDIVSLGEIQLLINKSKDECIEIAKKFVDKGLFKEIIGATPHYTALPPYAALVSQLNNFSDYISDIKKKVPPQLMQSFTQVEEQAEGIKKLKDYAEFMIKLKENMLAKMLSQKEEFNATIQEIGRIKEINKVISNLEGETKNLMKSQIEGLTKQFGSINIQIEESMKLQIDELINQNESINTKISQIIKNQIEDLTNQLGNIREKISSNIKKLQLGVVQRTVNRVIEKVFASWIENITENLTKQFSEIQTVTNDGLTKTKIGLNRQLSLFLKVSKGGIEKINEKFNTEFIPKLKTSIEKTVNYINEITTSTTNSGENIKHIFTDVSDTFNEVVKMAGEKISGVSDKVYKSFGNLKDTFSTKIIDTLNTVLSNILKKLEISEITTTEFWEQAKKVSLYTMKDIWFIRSVEGARAHLNDELSKAKAKILIVAPKLMDIDIKFIKAIRKHVNVRIATFIDPSLHEDKKILEELDTMPNVTYRHRKLQNLWGINRDYEEVILCVFSESKIGGTMRVEIAGIGSIIQEHIKIFVPILEDAWLGSQKTILVEEKSTIKKKDNLL